MILIIVWPRNASGEAEIVEEQIVDPHIQIANHDIGGVVLLDERIRIERQLGGVKFLLKGSRLPGMVSS
jgi:hypothetical protein